MLKDATVENEVPHLPSFSRKPKRRRVIDFPWKHCQVVVALLLFCIVPNVVLLQPQTLMHQTMLLYSNVIMDQRLFNILCTTERRRMTGGSYIIRCQDFKGFAEHCTKNVRVHLYSHDQLIFKPNGPNNNTDGWKKDFNATVTVKIGLVPKPRFGKLFMDVVDRYTSFDGLDSQVEVIVQTKYHAQDQFPNRTYHVVEHWYNSFPEDMLSSADIPKFELPKIQPVSNMKMATVWTNMKQLCPTLSFANNSDVKFDCINERFGIAGWYQKYFNRSTASFEMQRLDNLLQDPRQGPGRIYYELFWKYNLLLVPAKTALPEKLRYGNVQRAVSQMRSGVPVLLEIYGEVLEDFMDRYNYTCAYKNTTTATTTAAVAAAATQKHNDEGDRSTSARKYWTLDEAVMAMKESPEIRRKCQKEGLAIAADYSPASLVERELRILGYDGDFDCP